MMAKRIVGNPIYTNLIFLKLVHYTTINKFFQKNHFAGCIFDCYVVIQTEGRMKRPK